MRASYPQQQEVTSGICLNGIPETKLSFSIASQNCWQRNLSVGNLSVLTARVWQQCSQPCADSKKSPPLVRIRDAWICNEKLLSLWKNVVIQLHIKFFSSQVIRSHSTYIMRVLQSEGYSQALTENTIYLTWDATKAFCVLLYSQNAW